jgi:hypothetical protein
MPGMKKTMSEWKEGKLHSGSKHGPVVKSQKQAIAIGLSEARKEGEHVAKKHHSFESSNRPFGQTKAGEEAAHAIPQGHKVHGPMGHAHDGAGRKGHDMEMHHMSEHKAPHHPEGSHTKQGHDPVKDGAYGYPGETTRMDDKHYLAGGDYSQTAHEPARLKTPDGQGFTAGHPGIHAGMESKPHGYGHGAHQRSGNLRNSGHPGAHRIGKR